MLTIERLRSRLSYNIETGEFRWRVRPRQRACADIAGSLNQGGYRQICVDQKMYKAHRLAWFCVHGIWPAEHIDHINGNRDDNRIANLREASWSENQANSRRRTTNVSGMKGVSFHAFSGLWYARITVRRRQLHLGYFHTKEEAHSSYVEAATLHFGEFARVA